MPTSEAQKRASRTWDSKHDSITLRLKKETGAAIRAAAAASGQTVTAYILAAIQNGGGANLPVDYKAIQEHIAKTGESFVEFINRAVENEIARDNQMGFPVIRSDPPCIEDDMTYYERPYKSMKLTQAELEQEK